MKQTVKNYKQKLHKLSQTMDRRFINLLFFAFAADVAFPVTFAATNHTKGSPGNITDAVFDTSPLKKQECNARPRGACKPVSPVMTDCAFLQKGSFDYDMGRQQTHVTLKCDYWLRKDVTKDIFKVQTTAISRANQNRAVYVEIMNDTFLEPEVILPIQQQIVVLKVFDSSDSNATSRVGLLRLTNLLEITFDHCKPLIVRQRDFLPMPNIRIILFYGTVLRSVEPGSFTDLPRLQIFGVANTDYMELPRDEDDKSVLLADVSRFYCDPASKWLWDWLEAHPQLSGNREPGSVYKIGSLQNAEITFQHGGIAVAGDYYNNEKGFDCMNGTIVILDPERCRASIFALELCEMERFNAEI
ncbi:uncharacterized protein LOC129595400 [Paramacrobiotus metropolitanus]|uniref:uncharacterized protein LOC129595400 n=1 Tax=Paramacrobiotus metropolitanus TaxID=2943436 RepID=UPI0024457F6C|nr:uncharacterized protein LOC129595400 [Paramacrobiotus metropolitanus]